MTLLRARSLTMVAGVLAASLLFAACKNSPGSDRGRESLLQTAESASRAEGGAAQDPCTLLSAKEAEPYVGVLAIPPYRASDGSDTPDVAGEECMYRGKDGRQVSVLADWRGGGMMGNVLDGIPKAIGEATKGTNAQGMDSMAGRVLQQGAVGPWDKTTWIPGGSLFVYKGDAQIRIDMSGASGQKNDAIAMAREIVPRIGHPLSYDGARAVAYAPKPRAHPVNPCDLVPVAEVEAAIGRLDGAPVADSGDASCTYRVATAAGERTYPVGYTWQDGQKGYHMLIHGMATVSGMLGTPASSPLDSMKLPPQAQQMLGGLMKMVGGQPSAGGKPSATGAVTTVGLRTDTTLKGPWDNAALLHGTQLIAVRGDVSVAMSLQSADYEKAKALLRAVCAHL
ncbi:MAG TPA: hypothetical protein VIM15_00725 [Gemmatimonadaceae bacterium]